MTLFALVMLLATGAVAGVSAGFLGIGGGAVLTPLCLLIYPVLGIHEDVMIKVIFGTNMFLVMAFSLSAALKHHGNNKIDWRTVSFMAPLAIMGSFTGAWAASMAGSGDLKKAFAVLLTISSILIIARGSTKPSGDRIDRKPILPLRLLPLLGFVTGFAGSFLGIGGGVVMIPTLILVFAFPVDRVAATSSSIIIFIGLTGMLSYMWHGRGIDNLPSYSVGYVWWAAAVPLMVAGVPMARVGAWLNAKTRDRHMQRIFGIVLFVLAVKILFF